MFLTVETEECAEVHIRILVIHLVGCRRGRVWVWDVMAAIVITKVDVLVCGVGLSRFEGLGMRKMLAIGWIVRHLVDGLVDNAVPLWKFQHACLRFCKDDLPLSLDRSTCAVGSHTEQVLHLRYDDRPLRVLDGRLVTTKEVIGEERLCLLPHVVPEAGVDDENR